MFPFPLPLSPLIRICKSCIKHTEQPKLIGWSDTHCSDCVFTAVIGEEEIESLIHELSHDFSDGEEHHDEEEGEHHDDDEHDDHDDHDHADEEGHDHGDEHNHEITSVSVFHFTYFMCLCVVLIEGGAVTSAGAGHRNDMSMQGEWLSDIHANDS